MCIYFETWFVGVGLTQRRQMWARCEADASLILLSRGHLRLQQISSASTCSTCLCRHVIWISVRDIQIKRCYNTQNTPTDCVWDWYSRLLVLAIRKNESIVSLVTFAWRREPVQRAHQWRNSLVQQDRELFSAQPRKKSTCCRLTWSRAALTDWRLEQQQHGR